jgi:hypothetical protein
MFSSLSRSRSASTAGVTLCALALALAASCAASPARPSDMERCDAQPKPPCGTALVCDYDVARACSLCRCPAVGPDQIGQPPLIASGAAAPKPPAPSSN